VFFALVYERLRAKRAKSLRAEEGMAQRFVRLILRHS
jgi:hypothetical protein